MENEQVQQREHDSRMRWIGLIGGLTLSVAAVHTIWSHGLRNLQWAQNAALALLCFSFISPTWQQMRGERSWSSRVFGLAYGALFGAWIGHDYGWVPGSCIIVIFSLSATERKTGWWSTGLKKPLGIVEFALIAVLVAWFIRSTKDWIVYACLVALLLLLASEKSGRRTLRQNLWRPISAAWVATTAASLFWLWKAPSFASVLLLIAIPVLWFGNLLMHLSSGERPLALSHPQS
jgi:hypothetical protein